MSGRFSQGRSFRGGRAHFGRGGGRGSNDGGRGRRSNGHYHETAPKGLIPTLPFLSMRNTGRRDQAECVQRFCEQLQNYTTVNFISGLDRIFDEESPAYPVLVEPDDLNAEQSRSFMQKEKWKLEYSQWKKDYIALEADSKKLCGVLLGQLDDTAKDKIRQTEAGAAAIINQDPLGIVAAIRSSCLTSDGRVNDEQNYFEVDKRFRTTSQFKDEHVKDYYARFKARFSALSEAARRAAIEEQLPQERMRCLQLINGLNERYSDLKAAIKRNIVSVPDEVAAAYELITSWGDDGKYRERSITRAEAWGHNSYVLAARRGGFGGRGRGGGRYQGAGARSRGRGRENDRCNKCNQLGHWAYECHGGGGENHSSEGGPASKGAMKAAVDEVRDTKKQNS